MNDEDHLFIEETILIDKSKDHQDYIKDRIELRKKMYNCQNSEITFEEIDAFPMGGSKKKLDKVPSMGGANRDVHPTTGYMVGYAVNRIPKYVKNIIKPYEKRSDLLKKIDADFELLEKQGPNQQPHLW